MFQKLGLVPPTPPVSFAAANTPAAAERIASFKETLRMSPETGLQHLALFFTSVKKKIQWFRFKQILYLFVKHAESLIVEMLT